MESYYGRLVTRTDALVLCEACAQGIVPRVKRRLALNERESIRSGTIYIWDERESGLRRWTDGKSWSASRVSGPFLTYREMEGKKVHGAMENIVSSEEEVTEGFRYKRDGLVKQSISVTTLKNRFHLIAYVNPKFQATLPIPSRDARFANLVLPEMESRKMSASLETQPDTDLGSRRMASTESVSNMALQRMSANQALDLASDMTSKQLSRSYSSESPMDAYSTESRSTGSRYSIDSRSYISERLDPATRSLPNPANNVTLRSMEDRKVLDRLKCSLQF